MPGFKSVSEFAKADENGQSWITGFIKNISSASATTPGGFTDYMYFEGSPYRNRYLGDPLKSALINSLYGINIPCVAPAKQFVNSLTTMNALLGSSSVNIKQRLMIADYLMFYPFIDGSPDEQIFQNTVTLPRYSYGQIIAVCQSAVTTEGAFTVKYTNQSGVSGRVSKTTYTKAFTYGGEGQLFSVSASVAQGGGGLVPFIILQEGDLGVSSIQSVTCSAGFTGLMALVIITPLFYSVTSQSIRQYNSDTFGAADQLNMIIHQARAPHIIDGAVLGILAQSSESLASTAFLGILETVWK